MILLKASTADGVEIADASTTNETIYNFSDFYSSLSTMLSNKEIFGFVTEEQFVLIEKEYGVR